MPELPEVETIARGLAKQCLGRKILGTELHTPSVLRAGSLLACHGRTIEHIHRRAKLLLLTLSNSWYVLFHLKMTGRIWLAGAQEQFPKHTHILFKLDAGEHLVFEDTRRFGFCGIWEAKNLHTWPFYSNLGPEPLQTTPQDLAKRFHGKKARIKSLLLDQRLVAGIGNIYADESLFAAGIHPATPTTALSEKQLIKLFHELQNILHRAIHAGGSTISDYRNAYGQQGIFQDEFCVYGKKGAPCPRCGAQLLTQKVAGRTSTHCPICQQISPALSE